jgi:hypothetical protein
LTSYMSVTYQRPIINSMSDLAANPSYNMACVAGAIQYIDLTVYNINFCMHQQSMIHKAHSHLI